MLTRKCSLGISVAPFAGAWIEITGKELSWVERNPVAPFAGAWIEIDCTALIRLMA